MSLLSGILPKKNDRDYILILGVETHHIRAIVCSISAGKSEIVGSGQSDFSVDLDETEAADIAISMAEKSIPEGILIEKVILALPAQFVEGDRVKPEYISRLQKITKTLSLIPFGFVEYQSAIANYFESEEGSALSAIAISVETRQLTFTLLRLGKIQKNVVVERSSEIGQDLAHAITSFNVDILPSRIILYDELQNLETLKEELLKFSWHKQSAFLHTPKIEILSKDTILKALSYAASAYPTITAPMEVNLEDQQKKVAKPHKEKADFGFETVEELPDRKQMAEIEELPDRKHMSEHDNIKEFDIHEDLKQHQKQAKHYHEDNFAVSKPQSSVLNLAKFSNAVLAIGKRLKGLTDIALPIVSLNKTLVVVVLAVTVGLALAIAVFATGNFAKAKIHVLVFSQKVTSELEVNFTQTLTPSAPSIHVESVAAQVSGEKTASTTGKTKIGEKAKGEVVVYNKSTGAKTLPKGAILSANNLQFTFDDTVQIASASDTGEGLTFGKMAARVTASSIGPEGNIAANTLLAFKDYPDTSVNAKTTQAFSGGSAREVGSVAKEDQNELLQKLNQELSEKLKQELIASGAAGQKLLEPSFETKTVSKEFSAEVGSEAKSLTLSMTVSGNAFSYSERELLKLPDTALTAPSGFASDPIKTKTTVERIKKEKDGGFTASVQVSSYFIPQLDMEAIRKNIAGKSFDEVSSYIKSLSNVGGVKITQIQTLPFGGNKLPKQKNNIEVIVQGL